MIEDPPFVENPALQDASPASVHPPIPTSPPLGLHHPHLFGIFPALKSLLFVLIIALFCITFIVQPIRIPSASMEPTLMVGDFLLLDKQSTGSDAFPWLPPANIKRGDVIVFHDPVEDPAIHLVKRVIGIPGDRIHLHGGLVIRNGHSLQEDYAVYRGSPRDPFRDDFPDLNTVDPTVNANWWIQLRTQARDGEITVPPDCYFVLGDNRNDSSDSRYWGFVPRAAIVGKPIMIYFSWRDPASGQESGDLLQSTSNPLPTTLARRVAGLARWDRSFRIVH